MVGINIQSPWSSHIVNGRKCVETRSYPIPQRYIGETLALIETPGKRKDFKARIIGTIVFSSCIQYSSKEEWLSDESRHKVSISDMLYGWNDKPKFGWIVKSVKKFENPVDPPTKRGIIYAKNCFVEKQK